MSEELFDLPPLPAEATETNYEVWFAGKKDVNDPKFEQATVNVTTEKPISSLEELVEVSRTIGRTHGYAQLYIVSTNPPVENLNEILAHAKGTFGQMKEGSLE